MDINKIQSDTCETAGPVQDEEHNAQARATKQKDKAVSINISIRMFDGASRATSALATKLCKQTLTLMQLQGAHIPPGKRPVARSNSVTALGQGAQSRRGPAVPA